MPETLNDTISLMQSEDEIDQFRAEYHQLRIRYTQFREKLDKLTASGAELSCPKHILVTQMSYMERYLVTLECRAEMEGIDL